MEAEAEQSGNREADPEDTIWLNVTLRAFGYGRRVLKQVRETIDQAWLIV